MLLSRIANAIIAVMMLIERTTSLAPQTSAFFSSLEHTQHGSLEPKRELRRRQRSDLTSGTITITVAPDEVCGFDENDYGYSCVSPSQCSWESGEINNMFCDLTEITLGCLDRSFAIDTDYCNSDCTSNKYIKRCTETGAPICEEWQLGEDISAWLCMPFSTNIYLESTRSRKPRAFKTAILVDGTTITTWGNTVTSTDTGNVEGSSDQSDDTKAVTATPTDEEPESSQPEPTQTPTPPGKLNVGAVVGGVVGGLAVIGLTVLGIMLILRRNRKKAASKETPSDSATQSNAPDMRSVVSSPTLNQPYSPTTSSPIQSQSGGMLPQGVYEQPRAYGTASPGHLDSSTHELAGWEGDHQTQSSPGIK